MKNVTKKKANSPLVVTYGIKPEMITSHLHCSDTISTVDLGWMRLDFGWDEKWVEVLFAVTKKETILLSSKSSVPLASKGYPKDCEWVYAIDYLPPDFFESLKQKTLLDYAGFHIVHGVDSDNRNFLSVAMPNAELHLLFRDPEEVYASAWYPPRAVSLDNSMVIDSMAGALDLDRKYGENSSFDAELELLLG